MEGTHEVDAVISGWGGQEAVHKRKGKGIKYNSFEFTIPIFRDYIEYLFL